MQISQIALIVFEIITVLFSIIVHEVSHGYVAELLGDPTARLQGRLTLNPLKHIDPIGSIVVPIITSLGGFTFGWAKPVPFNPHNLKNRRSGELLIAAAGPLSNFFLALVFGLLIRFGIGTSLVFFELCAYVVIINVSLGIFNLIPFPPLDGSKVLFSLLPQTPAMFRARSYMERYSIVFVLLLVLFLWQFAAPLIYFLFGIFTGMQF